MKKANKEVDPRYRLTQWKGMPNYECTACAYATLDLNLFNAHWAKRHVVIPRPSPILLADASGREISNDPLASLDESDTEVSEDVDLEA